MGGSAADTIFALSSGRPPCAVAIIRISGSRAFDALQALCGRLPDERHASLARIRHPLEGDVIDEALVLRFSGPGSATGEDVAEIHCHGSRAVIDRVSDALQRIDGVRVADPGEFTRRALSNGRIDLTQAEGLADLLEAESEHQRRAALEMAEGSLRRQVDEWRRRLVDLSARAEAAIDYVGDEDETSIDEAALAQEARELASEIGDWLGRPRAEKLKDGVRVVLAGPPNSGKSSLLNALTESERAIVTDIAGTTRDSIEVPMSLAGEPLVLVDTAGLRSSADEVERIGIARAGAEIDRADILLWLGEPSDAPRHPCLLVVRSKCDLPTRAREQKGIPVSAKTRDGISQLIDKVVEMSKDMLPPEGEVAINRRQASELRDAYDMLMRDNSNDIVVLADSLRRAGDAFDRLTGYSGVEDMLDALFGRFCLGK